MLWQYLRSYLHLQKDSLILGLQRCLLTNFISIDVNTDMSDKKEKTDVKKKETEPSTAAKTTTKNETKKPAQADSDSEEEDATMEMIKRFFAHKFGLGSSGSASESGEKVIEDLSLDGLTDHWKRKGFKKIITMVGAGISTSAGIPDFRSPGSGLYDNLQKYNLPHPTAIFDMNYFKVNPRPFFALAKELYPGTFNPTVSHYFVRLLHEKGLLVRHYTQNIDTLERIACIPADKLVEAHGTFYTNHCLECRKVYSMAWMKTEIFADRLPVCTESGCRGTVKPDIVFFGENLPISFYELPEKDFQDCDLLIVMGTSLEVQPFASLVNRAGHNCMRLLINREKVGQHSSGWFTGGGNNLRFDDPATNRRDVAYIGDCDDGVLALAKALGWDAELNELMKREHDRLAKEQVQQESEKSPQTSSAKSDKNGDNAKSNDKPHKA